jgi:uncharacterized membrane protein
LTVRAEAGFSIFTFEPVWGSNFSPGSQSFLAVKLQSSSAYKGGFVPEETLATGLSDHAASGLAYITFVPSVVFLFTAPYNRNLTVRFHAWQSIYLNAVALAACLALYALGMIPVINLLDVILIPVVGIIFFVLWITLMVGTLHGRRVKLPFLGDLAEDQAISRRS